MYYKIMCLVMVGGAHKKLNKNIFIEHKYFSLQFLFVNIYIFIDNELFYFTQ